MVFDNIAGIEPGVTGLHEVREHFGDSESRSETMSQETALGDAEGDLFWTYDTRGLEICVYRENLNTMNPLVDEVRIVAPFHEILPCGLSIGQSLQPARDLIAEAFQITNEYEDAIYFVPAPDKQLLACIENMETNEVVAIELMRTTTTNPTDKSS